MRIVCDSCGTKYSISDEKVRGKLFKFRCKNCSHVIIVRGNEQPSEEPTTGSTDVAVSSDTAAVADEWFFVLDGEQAGPIGTDDVPDYIAAGQIDAETYMWREGMEDWLHVGDIPELAHLAEQFDEAAAGGNGHDASPAVFAGSGADDEYVDDDEATRVTAAPAADVSSAPTGGLFDASGFSEPSEADSLAPSYAGGTDLFNDSEATRPSGLGGGGGGLFAADAMGMSTATDLEDDDRLVGQRNENSVLFSLDTLQSAEADNNGSDLPTTEGSGLIDIKALAASQAATGGSDDARVTASAEQAMVAPAAVMPMGQRQSNKLLYGAIAAGAIVIIGLITAIVVVLTQGEEGGEAQAATGGETTPAETTETQETTTPQESGTPAVADNDAGSAPDVAAAPAGPTADEIRAASAGAGLMAASIDNKARAVAQEVADRPAERVASRDEERRSDRRSSREEDDDDDDDDRRSRADDDDDDDDDRRERTDRRSTSDGDDPVSDALSRIRGGSDDDDDDDSSSGSDDDDNDSSSRDDLPESLTTSEISRTIRRYGRRLSECRSESNLPEGEVLRVDVSMTLQGNGRVGSARADSSDPAADCIVDVVRDMRFDEFSGDAVNFTYPFRVR